MGRRKRSHSDDYDDSIERQFLQKQTSTNERSKKEVTNKTPQEINAGNELSNNEDHQQQHDHSTKEDNVDRQREKKRAKKQRQKEKKLAEKKRAQDLEAARQKHREELQQLRLEEKKRKEIDKKVPKSDNFIQTHKGVKYCDIQVGTGPVIQDRKKVRVKYTLRAKNKNGKILDSGGNFSFKMGKGEVISGWEIGLLRMRQGGVRHIIVPPKAGYGSKDIGGGPGADLYFEVTLLQC